MKTRTFSLIVAATLLCLNAGAFAQRVSTDEVAIRLGVAAWLSGRIAISQVRDVARLKSLYFPDVEATETLHGTAKIARGLTEYVALWQPFSAALANAGEARNEDLKLSINGDRAATTFTFVPNNASDDGRTPTCSVRVSLTWKRGDGFWRIAREELAPIQPGVAFDSARATTQR